MSKKISAHFPPFIVMATPTSVTKIKWLYKKNRYSQVCGFCQYKKKNVCGWRKKKLGLPKLFFFVDPIAIDDLR